MHLTTPLSVSPEGNGLGGVAQEQQPKLPIRQRLGDNAVWTQRLVFLASALPKKITVCSFLPILFPVIVSCLGSFSVCSLSVWVSQSSLPYTKPISPEMKVASSLTEHCALGALRVKLHKAGPPCHPPPLHEPCTCEIKEDDVISEHLQVPGTFGMLDDTDLLDK